MKKYTNKKIIASGPIIEIFQFQKKISYGSSLQKRDKTINPQKTSRHNLFRAEKSWRRTATKLKRLVNKNANNWFSDTKRKFVPIFATFTFKDNLKDIKIANYLFTKFIKRMNFSLMKSKHSILRYLAVIEFQERGAIHYHVIFFNLPYIEYIYDRIRKIWRHGLIRINAISSIRNVGAYVTEYMTKDLNDSRLCRQKAYFISRGLKKPNEIFDSNKVCAIEKRLPESFKKFETKFNSDYCGETKYKYFDLRDKSLEDFGVVFSENKD